MEGKKVKVLGIILEDEDHNKPYGENKIINLSYLFSSNEPMLDSNDLLRCRLTENQQQIIRDFAIKMNSTNN